MTTSSQSIDIPLNRKKCNTYPLERRLVSTLNALDQITIYQKTNPSRVTDIVQFVLTLFLFSLVIENGAYKQCMYSILMFLIMKMLQIHEVYKQKKILVICVYIYFKGKACYNPSLHVFLHLNLIVLTMKVWRTLLIDFAACWFSSEYKIDQ